MTKFKLPPEDVKNTPEYYYITCDFLRYDRVITCVYLN